MEAESSQAVRNHGKRPARVTLSDNESEASPRRANGTAKRRRSSHVDEGDSDLDILTEDEPGYGELANIKRETMNGHGGGGGDHEDEDQGSVNGVGDDGPLRPIGFRPDYERGSDG